MRRVAAIDGKGQFRVIEQPVPEPGAGEVQVEVKASLISPGTELGGVLAQRANPTDASPKPFGYQNAGLVTKTGPGVERFHAGDPVACMGGGYALHASHTVCPVNLTVPIPDGVSFEEAAFCHLAATSLHAMRRVAPGFGEYLGISGLGLVGQLAVAFGRLSGCHVVGLDRLPMRLDVARTMGADAVFNVAEADPVPQVLAFCGEWGLEAAIVAFGGDATEAMGQLYQMMRAAPDTHRWGRIAVVGGAKATLDLAAGMGNVTILSSARPGPGYHDDAWEHGADYPPVFVRWTTQRNLQESLQAMAEGKLDVRPLITDIFPLDDAPAACEKLVTAPGEALGVILKPDE